MVIRIKQLSLGDNYQTWKAIRAIYAIVVVRQMHLKKREAVNQSFCFITNNCSFFSTKLTIQSFLFNGRVWTEVWGANKLFHMQYTIFWLIWIFFRKPVFTLTARMTIFLHNYLKHTDIHTSNQTFAWKGNDCITIIISFNFKIWRKWNKLRKKKEKRKTIDALN